EGSEERQERERPEDLDHVAELSPPVDREAREERARIQERGEERPGRGGAQRAIEAEILVAPAGRMEGGDDPGEVRVEPEAERDEERGAEKPLPLREEEIDPDRRPRDRHLFLQEAGQHEEHDHWSPASLLHEVEGSRPAPAASGEGSEPTTAQPEQARSPPTPALPEPPPGPE